MDSIWTSKNPAGAALAPNPDQRPPRRLDPGQRNRFWWFVAFSLVLTIAVALGFAVLFWRGLSPADQQALMRIGADNAGYLFGGLILLIAAIFAGLDGMFNIYILPLTRLIEEFSILINVNPAHRVQLEGGRDIVRLAHMINAGADRVEALQQGIDDRVRQIRAQAEAEKQMLAAVLAELPQGVLLCNVDGQVLLYNRLARLYLSGEANTPIDGGEAECYLGLGRSVFRLLDQPCLEEAVAEMAERLSLHPEGDVGSTLILRGAAGRRLFAQTAPIVYDDGRYGGFILLLNDIERQIGFEDRFIGQWQRLRKRTGHLLASLGQPSAEEDMEYLRLRLMDELTVLNQTMSQVPPMIATGLWPLEPTPAAAFLWGLRHAAKDLELELILDDRDADCELELDVALMRETLTALISRLRQQVGVDTMMLTFTVRPPWAGLELIWNGPPVGPQWLRHQLGQPVQTQERTLPVTIKQVFDHHRIMVTLIEPPRLYDEKVGLRLDFPVFTKAAPWEDEHRSGAIVAPSRPEFYDFDLFHQPGFQPELGDRPLTELTYTVFDTETTGLDPNQDEIISIGAVRIVNGRILYEECFDQLVDPRRPLSSTSIQIHGITPDRLAGQPTIEVVLPAFQRFAEDTILLGHNVAFDLRMFQIKAPATGVVFINPVLDTILLSAVVNPSLKDHDLDAIAQRLLAGPVVNRHTALGDAVATAEIFLKLLPLLKEMGILTFGEALAAAQKTYYARLKY